MKQHILSGAPWEESVGYSRAIRVGNIVEVAGTTAVVDGQVQGTNAYEQAKICLEIIKKSLTKAGAGLSDVVRTRVYVTDITQWKLIGKAHGEFFGHIKPVTTMVQVSALIHADMQVEIEASAVVDNS